MKMPFGKYKGEHIEDIDDLSYLKWLKEQDWLKEDLRNALNHEIERRESDRPGKGLVKPSINFKI